MVKKDKHHSLHIHDFFGTYNTYQIFALQSDLSVFTFANKLGKALNITFTVLSDFDYVLNKLTAHFTVLCAEYTQQESIHCLLLENKTETNQQELFDSKTTDKTPHLLNYSLFEESLYLFNKTGLRCFDLNFTDVDYLLLLFAKKDIEQEILKQFLKNITPFKAQDISYLLERNKTSAEKKIVSFLRDFYCKYEVSANQFSRKKKMNLLAPVQQIPTQNLQYPIPILLEHDSIVDNLQLSEEYLAFLSEE